MGEGVGVPAPADGKVGCGVDKGVAVTTMTGVGTTVAVGEG